MKYNLIPDNDIDLRDVDYLGNITYVQALKEIITKCRSPFTIGLFGGWGTGKSSIITTLKNIINNEDSNENEVFLYDAWKYSQDSFRRTFIMELKKHFNLKTTDEYKRFYSDKSEEVDHKVDASKYTLLHVTIVIILLIVLNSVSYFATGNIDAQIGIISLIFAAITYLITQSLIKYKISITTPRLFAPEEFETIFRDAIKTITAEKNFVSRLFHKTKTKKRLIIAIDNVDRCHEELAMELLLTIKNFLGIPNVIFILPVDENGIKKFLGEDEKETGEFLRKLFNTSINIKEYSNTELFEFTSKINEKYGLGLSDIVISLISQEFTKNPRRIIQFLNNLQTQILLAELHESSNHIPKGAVTKNLQGLTKLEIIRDEWPKLYRILCENPGLLKKINQSFRSKDIHLKDLKDIVEYKHIISDLEFDHRQIRFLKRTQNIEIDNLEPFFINRDIFQDIPSDVDSAITNHAWEELKSIIKDKNISLIKILHYINNKITKDIINRFLFKTTGFNILALLIEINNDSEYSDEFRNQYNTAIFSEIKSFLLLHQIEDLLFDINPLLLVEFSYWLHQKGFNGLNQRILNAIISMDGNRLKNLNSKEKDLILEFINRYKDQKSYLRKLKEQFSKILSAQTNLYLDYLDIFSERNIANNLLSEDIITILINAIQNDILNKNNKKLLLTITEINNISKLSPSNTHAIIQKVLPFIVINDLISISFWLEFVKTLISNVTDENTIQAIFNMLNERYTFVYNTYAGGSKEETHLKCYKNYLDCLEELYKKSSDNQGTAIIGWFNNFYNINTIPEIYLYVNKIYQDIIEISGAYNWSFVQVIINKFNQVSDFADKCEIAETINLMMLYTEESKGVKKSQIETIFKLYTNSLIDENAENKEVFESWLYEITKGNDYIKNILSDYVLGLNNSDKISLLINAKKIFRKRLGIPIIENILVNSTEETVVDDIDRLVKNLDETIIDSALEKVLKEIKTENIEMYKYVLTVILSKSSLKTKQKIQESLVDKIRPLLAGDKQTEIEYAINLLVQFESIPSNKKDLLRSLINEIDIKTLTEDSQKQLKNIKKLL